MKKAISYQLSAIRLFGFILILFVFFSLFSFHFSPVRADELDDLQKQINELSKAREMSVNATKPLEGQLASLKVQLAQIQNKLAILSANITQKEKDIKVREDKLVTQQALLSQRVRSYYIRSYAASPLMVILSSGGSGNLFRELTYRQAATKEDQSVISQVTADMMDIITQKEKLVKDKAAMAIMRIEVDKNAKFIGGEVAKAKDYQGKLTSQIAQLSARQQQIINERLGSLNLPTSLGAGPLNCVDDRNASPDFSPAFAFFTFGIPHRVGLNQYGALGRAKAGQNYQDILRAYFNDISFEKRGNNNIKVQGYGEMPIETYLLGIYEMPGSWPMEALKAQVVAARSYALAYTGGGAKEICTTQSCQVYKGGNKGGDWERAVKATEGEVLVSGGQVISAWYASTAGGYTFTSADVGWGQRGWTKRTRDATGDVGSFADIIAKSYDRDSPCLYSAQGYRKEFNKTAWLKSSELADIVNVILLVRADSGTREHISQMDKSGGDNWDSSKVKEELRNRGKTPFDSISSVSISADFGTGMTSSVSISGDNGSESFSGNEFKNFFNVRAPANISIVGPLFNVERK